MNNDAYLCLVTWPNGTEGLLFPRPGNVPLAATLEMGEKDFETACVHLHAYIANAPPVLREKVLGATIRLVKFERKEVLKEFKKELDEKDSG